MKKVILAALMLVSGAALAVDVGGYGGTARGTNGKSENLVGLSVGDNLGKLGLKDFGVQATADRSTTNVTNVNRYIASGSYDVIKLGYIQTNVRIGVAYLDPQSTKASNGGAGIIGFGVSLPLSDNIKAVADYAYQKGNNITKNYNGNYVTAGVKYSF